MTDELKMIVDLFSQVTDGVLIGGIAFLVFQFLTNVLTLLAPWVGSYFLLKLVMERLPKVTVGVKKKESPTS